MKSRKAIVIGFAFALAILTFLSVGYASAVTTHYVNPGDSLLAIKGVSGSSLVDYHPASFSKEFQQHPPKTQDRASSSVNTWIVISVADSGQGTLRQAMLEASSGDTIAFDPAVFSPASPATIKLTSSELPELIQGNITIDASNAGVILDGVNNSHGSGLRIHSDHNVVKGLQILHFPEYGVHLTDGINNTITDNCAYNNSNGIYLSFSSNNTITGNDAYNNDWNGICLVEASNNNNISSNYAYSNWYGIFLSTSSSDNTLIGNYVYNNWAGINFRFDSGDNNTITGNKVYNNSENGISMNSPNNLIYNNYFDNTNNAQDDGNNLWNITRTFGTNIVGGSFLGGNYWSDYNGDDLGDDGLGDTLLPYNSSGGILIVGDWLPLVAPAFAIFDTDKGTYPSISGTNNDTITPKKTLNVSKLYTYPCLGTGGHTEYVKIWKGTETIAEGNWTGYQGDWHNLSFDSSIMLEACEMYNYTIKTGSYPQIIHEPMWNATGGKITCTEFVDANGDVHTDWIPAIRLE